jgi:hypothetical protein
MLAGHTKQILDGEKLEMAMQGRQETTKLAAALLDALTQRSYRG